MTKRKLEAQLKEQQANLCPPSPSNLGECGMSPVQEVFAVELSGDGVAFERASVASWEVASVVRGFAQLANELGVRVYSISVEK